MFKIFFSFIWILCGIVLAQSGDCSTLNFITNPASVTLSKYGEPVALSCVAKCDGQNKSDGISYQWFLGKSNAPDSAVEIVGANGNEYVSDGFDSAEVRYYFCVAKNSEGTSIVSSTATVAYTGLPLVNIETVGGEIPTAEVVYNPHGGGQSIANATKVPSSMQITDATGNVVYASGEYQKKVSGLTIKIRGNTSVDIQGKSSYKLKLQKKADLLSALVPHTGLNASRKSYDDKEWVLLKSAQTFDAVLGFQVCDIVGVPWTPRYAFVNVFINGDYRGLYLLAESVKQNANRVNVSDDGYIVERDAYWWNESLWFETSLYRQQYTFKYPDDDDVTSKQLEYIKNYMDEVETHIVEGTYKDYLDGESFARWILIHDFLGSWDVAGSNVFMAKDNSTNSKIYMLTNWDFDSNFMQEDDWSKQHYADQAYISSLFRSTDRTFAYRYKALLDSISPLLWTSLENWIKDIDSALGKQIDASRYCDSARWNFPWRRRVSDDYFVAKIWFELRLEWMNQATEKTRRVRYELNGGRFDTLSYYPDTIRFLSRITIPQVQRKGYTFTGWTTKMDSIPRKNKIIYGYQLTDDEVLTANWQKNGLGTNSAVTAQWIQNGGNVGPFDVFGITGRYLGRMNRVELPAGTYFVRDVKNRSVQRVTFPKKKASHEDFNGFSSFDFK